MYCSYELLYTLTISNLRTFSSKSVYIETSLFYTRQRSFIKMSCSVMKIPSVYKILTIVTSGILWHIQENLLGSIIISGLSRSQNKTPDDFILYKYFKSDGWYLRGVVTGTYTWFMRWVIHTKLLHDIVFKKYVETYQLLVSCSATFRK